MNRVICCVRKGGRRYRPVLGIVWCALYLAMGVAAVAAEDAPGVRVMMTAPATVGSPNPLFAEPCRWPVLRDRLDGYKYYGRQFMQPPERRLDAKAFAGFTRKAGLEVGVEFGHMFLPREGARIEPWEHWLKEAVREIQPVFDAGGRVHSVHIDGPIRRLLGFGGGGGQPQRSLPYDQAVDQFVRFWIALQKQYPGIEIGYLVNFPNWDYTEQHHGYHGHFTDRSGKLFDDVLTDFHKKLKAAGGTIAFVEIDCPYRYYVATKTRKGDAKVDNPGKFRALEKWCEARDIRLHMIVNEAVLSRREKNPTPQRIAKETQRFLDNTLRYVQSLKDDGITPDVFLVQSWYAVPQRHVPESAEGTMTHIALQVERKIRECFEGDAAAAAAAARKPNVVLFLVDDMGWMDSTPYGSRYY